MEFLLQEQFQSAQKVLRMADARQIKRDQSRFLVELSVERNAVQLWALVEHSVYQP